MSSTAVAGGLRRIYQASAGRATLRTSMICAATLAVTCAAPPMANAADADPTGRTPGAGASDVSTVSPCFGTAERRSVNLQRAPVAASVLTAEQVKAQQVTTVEQLQFITPSMSVSSGLEGNQVEIRGIGRGD